MDTNFLFVLDVLMRGLTVVLALFICYELNNYSADVVRSRLFVAYNKLKFSFYFLALALFFFFFEPLLSSFQILEGIGYRYTFAMFFFQVSFVFLLHNIYVALKPPRKIL
ncbi:MAG: hypothetical protein WBL02_01710 [Methanomethylovorans sp.]|uniref:hypothetical protein n=1 Tax=Methanomethylovorans sp. TaxID=2758717 RepID=UPI000AB51524|nr:hypothetical protein [Methanomethylovorans sp.]